MITRTLTNHTEKRRKIDIDSLFIDYRYLPPPQPPPPPNKMIFPKMYFIYIQILQNSFHTRLYQYSNSGQSYILGNGLKSFLRSFSIIPSGIKRYMFHLPIIIIVISLVLTSHGQSLWVFRYASESFIFKIDILNVSWRINVENHDRMFLH